MAMTRPSRAPASARMRVREAGSCAMRSCNLSSETNDSRQPRLPHSQVGPFGSTTTCAISPAVEELPSMMTSLRHSAAPTPRPMEMSMELGEQSPKNRSATSAALVSLPTSVGTPVAFSTSAFSGSSFHSKCTDLRTTPSGSTMPVTAMPMPRIGSGVEAMSCLHRLITSSTLQPLSAGSSVRSTILPERSASAPLASFGFDRSMETIRQKSVSMASTCERLPRPSRLSGPSSRRMRLSTISPVTSLVVKRESPMSLPMLARDICVAGNSCLNAAVILLIRISEGDAFV